MEDKKVSITSEDWENLIPGKEITIASQKVIVRPLGFKKFTETLRKVKAIQGELTEAGVTIENYATPGGILSITNVVLERLPEIIEDSCNIDSKDVDRLPMHVAAELVSTILDVNIDSQKGLLKNLLSLAEKTTKLVTEASAI